MTPIPILRRGDGPPTARIMIIGEAYGEHEESAGLPFVGASGEELNRCLHAAGIMRSECFITNVVNARPPRNDLTKWMPVKKGEITAEHVRLRDRMVLPVMTRGYQAMLDELRLVSPDLVIALGNTALWALTGHWGILKWRGSQLYSDTFPGLKVIPTVHPAAILREYAFHNIAIQDLRRAAKHRYPGPYQNVPDWQFTIRPSLEMVRETLASLLARCEQGPIWIEFDLETSPTHITCAGLSWSRTEAICIPFTENGRGFGHYWSTEVEEGEVVFALYRLLTHPNCWVGGQNLLYDVQHTYRWWHFVPNVKYDTMIGHHTCFAGMKKSLDFQSSMYNDYYTYWKDMHKDESNKAGA